MPTIRRHPLAEQAAEAILDRLRAGEWPVGHKLPGETTLATQLGVGRSTVREAVRELAGKGVLASRQGSGVHVLAVDTPADWSQTLQRAAITDVVEARVALETRGARLAAVRRSPADLRRMRSALVARTAARAGSPEDYVDADTALHRTIVAAAQNSVLLDLFDAFVPRMREAMIALVRLHPQHGDTVDDGAHTAIVDAIRDRDAERASSAASAHLDTLAASLTH